MIPKVINYCWFGKTELPELAIKCINSWKKFLPDYEIKEWNEDNFDINIIPYTTEAYKAKKYAFVSDYARFWILYHYGGLYFDTDVEIIKSIDDIMAKGAFLGCEKKADGELVPGVLVNPGLGMGASPRLPIYKEILDFYSKLSFIKYDGSYNMETVVTYTTNILNKHKLLNTNQIQKCADIWIYPKEYFCPYGDGYVFENTDNTRTIHYGSASWFSPWRKFKKKMLRVLGPNIAKNLIKIKQKLNI